MVIQKIYLLIRKLYKPMHIFQTLEQANYSIYSELLYKNKN